MLGITGEPGAPQDAAKGIVWSAILDQIDRPGSESEWVSANDSKREKFAKHPWSIGGGGAAELNEAINTQSENVLGDYVQIVRKKHVIGFGCVMGEDEAFTLPLDSHRLSVIAREHRRPVVEGELIRDWNLEPASEANFP